jgi:hypothetical protein
LTGVFAVLAWRAAYDDDDEEDDADGVVLDLEALAGVGSDNNTCGCGCCCCAFARDEFICTAWLTVDARPSVSGGAVAGPAARARAEAETAATEEAFIGEANVAACKRERLRTGTPERGQDDIPTKSKREMRE